LDNGKTSDFKKMRISYLRDIIIIMILLTFWISDLIMIGTNEDIRVKALLLKNMKRYKSKDKLKSPLSLYGKILS
jgi:hypothetical protein